MKKREERQSATPAEPVALDDIDAPYVREHGDCVYSNDWDSGTPMDGGSERVYRVHGRYWFLGSNEMSGPYDALDETLRAHEELLLVTTATEEVSSSELTTEQLIERIDGHLRESGGFDTPEQVLLNGVMWTTSEEDDEA